MKSKSLKAAGEIIAAMYKNLFEWMILAIMVIIVVAGWNEFGAPFGLISIFLGAWILWHRFFLTDKALLIKYLEKRIKELTK